MLNPSGGRQWINPSKRLVDKAIDRWVSNNLRADNTSVVTGMSQDYVMSLLTYLQGDPNRNFSFQIAVALKLFISDPMLVRVDGGISDQAAKLPKVS